FRCAPDARCIARPATDARTLPRPITMHGASSALGREPRMPVVTLLNQKGGVGKTSTTHHLAGTLAADGRRILLVDVDPQASLSQGFWGPAATVGLDPAKTVAAILGGLDPFPEQVVHPSGIPGIDLVAGSKHATDFNVPRPFEAPPEAQARLRDFLA